jgi:hypothetical protein
MRWNGAAQMDRRNDWHEFDINDPTTGRPFLEWQWVYRRGQASFENCRSSLEGALHTKDREIDDGLPATASEEVQR